MDSHLSFKGVQGFKCCLLWELQVLSEISLFLDLGFEHSLKVLDLFGKHISIAPVLGDILPGDDVLHLIYHFIDLDFGLFVCIEIVFHVFSWTCDSLLDLLETMHHKIEILVDKILIFFNLLFDKIHVSFIVMIELLIDGLQFMVKLRDLKRLLIGCIDKILQDVFIQLIFLIKFLKCFLENLLNLLLERLHRVIHCFVFVPQV